jgi:hypothetical protein
MKYVAFPDNQVSPKSTAKLHLKKISCMCGNMGLKQVTNQTTKAQTTMQALTYTPHKVVDILIDLKDSRTVH